MQRERPSAEAGAGRGRLHDAVAINRDQPRCIMCAIRMPPHLLGPVVGPAVDKVTRFGRLLEERTWRRPRTFSKPAKRRSWLPCSFLPEGGQQRLADAAHVEGCARSIGFAVGRRCGCGCLGGRTGLFKYGVFFPNLLPQGRCIILGTGG